APGASPAASMTPFEQGHGKKGKAQTVENEPRASITPGSSPAESFEQSKGKHKGQGFETGPGASVAPGSPPNERFEQGQGKHKGNRHDENFQPGSQNVGGGAGGGGKRREQIQSQAPPLQGGQYGQQGGQQGGQGKGKGKKGETSPTPSPR